MRVCTLHLAITLGIRLFFREIIKKYASYCIIACVLTWSEWRGSNPRPDGPKPPALPTALHPVVKFLPIQTAYVSGLTFILTYILYINTAESAIFFSARLPHCTAISLSGTALLHISATRYIFNSLNTAKIAVAWYSCM